MMMYHRDFRPGDLVWFDPGVGYVLPGEVMEYHKAAQVITVQAVINNVSKTFTLNNLSSVKSRQDLGQNGVDDMIVLSDLNEASILWNLRLRYDNNNIYTYIGSILVAVNPYRMFDIYGLDAVSKYEGQIIGTLPPHLFAVGASAYHRLLAKDGENQVVVITGESGAGKTESTKLLMQYLAAVNKSSSNLITEQILEASPLLESFGNAKSMRNDNSSRFAKYVEILYKDGIISGAKIHEYLLEKSRIVSHAPEERNYHIFYEMLAGLPQEQKETFGLMSADKYFYLNQGGLCTIDGKSDKEDFDSLQSAMQVLGFTLEEKDTIFKILASILHLGNVYFHRKQLRHGQEGVEIGSDVEIKWTAHLLQLNIHGISKALITKYVDVRSEEASTPLNIDQALDARDAIAKALYSSLFTWLIGRVNKICSNKTHRRQMRNIISILDIFGFEDVQENSFEQLCINFANESLQYHFNKFIFKLEQAEYAKEKIEWTPIPFNDNHGIIQMLSKKPVGIFHLLDDESNFPKATDVSFLEKCHYNHALNELYSRPRMSSMEFGIKHYAGQVWYNVEGFLDKNRDTLRYDVMSLLISSRDKMISKMFLDLRNFQEASRTMNKAQGHFVTMKPRQPTVAARFHESLNNLLQTISTCHPFYIRCIKPNNDKTPMKFDMPVVLEQLRHTGMLETIRIRKSGYPVRMKYSTFAQRYRCLLRGMIPRGAPTKEITRVILDREPSSHRNLYALGSHKIFLREALEKKLESERQQIMGLEVVKIQRMVRGYLARKDFNTKKANATKIQSAFRGYQVRKEYDTVRKGVVALQAQYRMRRQQSLYGEMKHELKRRAELAAIAREERKKMRAISEDRLSHRRGEPSPHRSKTASPREAPSRTVASVNQLEIPSELEHIFGKLDHWQPVNSEKNLAKVSGEVAKRKEKLKLPHDIDYYVFSKVANVYFKSHLWQMKRDPIKTPFLAKSKDSDYNESLSIFKLILRFMNDDKLGGMREKVLGDYIVNKGIQNEKLRDEIYCQLVNQTWKNDNEENCERGWFLMSQCLSAFKPSKLLYKYLIKYSSDHGYNGFKNVCQRKLLKAGKVAAPNASRQFPPTMLEYRSNKKRVNMALDAKCPDGYSKQTSVDSFTSAEEFAATLLKNRSVPELQGWTVSLEEEDMAMELNGGDFVMDAIGQIELAPSFPANRGAFLITTDRSKGQLPLLINTGPHNFPGKYNRYASASPPDRGQVIARNQRARSQDRLLAEYGNEEMGLSKSALNERYFGEKTATKSRSLDNLLGNDSSTDLFGLSQSRLNKRYRNLQDMRNESDTQMMSPEDLEMESISQRGGARDKWDDIGLSKTPLNERYFSQPELDKVIGDPGENNESSRRRYSEKNAQRTRSQSNITKLDGIEIPNFEYAANPEELRASGAPQVPQSGVGGRKLHGHPRYVKGQGRRGKYDKSSAMSDTSEAPSIASHVRGVRVPSQASDVDQFLDDLFMPVLDGTHDDGLSDARSLAASMRGGRRKDEEIAILSFSRQNSLKRRSILKQGLDILDWTPDDLAFFPDDLVFTLLKGGKDGVQPGDTKPDGVGSNPSSAMGFQPIPGVVSPTPNMSGMMSPPPMLMPTPVHSLMNNAQNLTSPLFMQGPQMMSAGYPGSTTPDPNGQPAMAFTYVPVPVYNMGGMSLPGFQGMMPGGYPPSGIISPSPMSPVPPKNEGGGAGSAGPSTQEDRQRFKDSSTPAGPTEDQSHQQMAYQQAFLQNAVAQNMQIQQQLLVQNQALTQLLQNSSGPTSHLSTSANTPMPSMMYGAQSPQGRPNHSFSQRASVERDTLPAARVGKLTDNQMRKHFGDYERHNHGDRLKLSEHQMQECFHMFTRHPPNVYGKSEGQVQEGFQEYLKDLHMAQVHQTEDATTPLSPYDKLSEQELKAQYKEYLKQNQGDSNHDQLSEPEFRRQFQELLRQQPPDQTFFGMGGEDGAQQRRISADNVVDGNHLGDAHRSKSFPNTPKVSTSHGPQDQQTHAIPHGPMDPYSRARTVRIGKWRWPPPKDLMGADGEGFFEFKMRKMQERKISQEISAQQMTSKDESSRMNSAQKSKAKKKKKQKSATESSSSSSSESSSSSSSSSSESSSEELTWDESAKVEKRKKRIKRSQLEHDSFGSEGEVDLVLASKSSSDDENRKKKKKLKKEKREKKDKARHNKDDNVRKGSVGKLKLSSEMKQKLEAVTGGGSRKSSMSSGRDSKERTPASMAFGDSLAEGEKQARAAPKNLDETRKMLLEQKLGGGKLKKWDTVEEVHRSTTKTIPDAPNRKSSRPGEIPLPPPPPPANTTGGGGFFSGLKMPLHFPKKKKKDKKEAKEKDEEAGELVQSRMTPLDKTPSSASVSSSSSSAYSPDGSLPDPRALPPAPIKPREGFQIRRPSVETQNTEKSEKYDIEESSEFLQPVDAAPVIVDEDDYQTLEDIKTTVHPPYSQTFFGYNRVPWNLKIRKEMFSPSETLNSPLAINLIFCQIVQDVFSPLCIRLTTEERSRMKTLLDEYDIDLKNLYGPQHKLSTKKNIIEMAKDFNLYFSRLYPIASDHSEDPSMSPGREPQYMAVSHSGVKLAKRQKSLPTDYLEVLDTYNYEDIGEVSTTKSNGVQLVMHQGDRVVVHSDKAVQLKDLLNQYIIESNSGQFDYVKGLADFNSRDESTLNFKKGEVIAVVPKHDAYTEKGWLYGIKDGQYGLFPSDFVERMSPQAIRREMRVIANVTRSSNMDPASRRGHSEEDEDEESFGDDEEEVRMVKPEPPPLHQVKARREQRNSEVEPDYSGQEDSWDHKRQTRPTSTEQVADNLSELSASAARVSNDGKHPLLEFAMRYFREKEKFEMLQSSDGTLVNKDQMSNKKNKKVKKKKNSSVGTGPEGDWTWKDQVEMVKWTEKPINNSLLSLEPSDINKMALECFACIMRYMGDLPLLKNQHEVDCVNTILMYCHKFESIRDEVYCQIMKQTTNNKSPVKDSCQKGWRLFSIIAAYFNCSDLLQPFLFKYLETAAYDKRRAYHGTALVCLHNLRKTFKYGGRKNVPSIEEITAISAGRSSKRQIYRLPGGTERVINTKSTTVVENIIEELCNVIGVDSDNEKEEFSLYCIVEGETFTVPLAKEHYILDVTTELQRDGAIYYLIFCRSVWYYPLRLENQLYIEVVFNQIAPDYLEGLLLVMPSEQIEQDFVFDIAKVAALLHRAADMDHKPTIKETKFLLPKPALSTQHIKPPQWVSMVQASWEDIQGLKPSDAKAQVLDILSSWPLFGSSFFAVRREADAKEGSEHILALNKNGVSFLDLVTHETLLHYPFTEVISTRKVQTEDGTLFLDMKCGNLMQQRITRIQTEQANEIARLIRQYITIDQRLRGTLPATNGNSPNRKSPERSAEEKRQTPSR